MIEEATHVPLSAPFTDGREEELVLRVLRSGRLSLGPTIDEFEATLSRRIGVPHAAAVSSGTAALHLCVRAAGLGPGDEVITSPFSFVASANCLLYEGAIPVFADVDPRTLNLDPELIEAAISPRTRAILPVDIFGYPCELDPIREICRQYELELIEDACEALGAEYRGQALGSHGHLTVFAFYPNKQITTGEGGVVVTNDEEEWRRLKGLSNQGRADSGGWLEHRELGYNYRMSDLAAAIGVGQIEKLDDILARRQEAASRYASLLGGVKGLELPHPDDADHVRSWFVYPVRLADELDRELVIRRMAGEGIATSRYLPSIHLQPYMRERFDFREGMFPVAEHASRTLLALPFFTSIDSATQERVSETLIRAIEGA